MQSAAFRNKRVSGSGMKKMVPRGLEPRSLWLLAVSSNQVSYETVEDSSDNMLWRKCKAAILD